VAASVANAPPASQRTPTGYGENRRLTHKILRNFRLFWIFTVALIP
jgi:hypothetical protein